MPFIYCRKQWLVQFWIFKIWITEQPPVRTIENERKASQSANPESPSVNPPVKGDSHEKE